MEFPNCMLQGSNERWEATAVSFLLFQNNVYSSKDERLACLAQCLVREVTGTLAATDTLAGHQWRVSLEHARMGVQLGGYVWKAGHRKQLKSKRDINVITQLFCMPNFLECSCSIHNKSRQLLIESWLFIDPALNHADRIERMRKYIVA